VSNHGGRQEETLRFDHRVPSGKSLAAVGGGDYLCFIDGGAFERGTDNLQGAWHLGATAVGHRAARRPWGFSAPSASTGVEAVSDILTRELRNHHASGWDA